MGFLTGFALGMLVSAFLFLWAWPPRRDIIVARGCLSMSKQLNVGESTHASVEYLDKAGTQVEPVGVPVWAVNDPNVASISASVDGMTAVITALAVGAANITVTAEGDAVAGVDTITLSGAITVVDEASSGTLSFD